MQEPTTGTHQLRERISRAGLDDGGDDGCGLRAFEGSRVVAEADAPQLLAKLAQHCAACVLLSECARAVCGRGQIGGLMRARRTLSWLPSICTCFEHPEAEC